MTSATPPGEGVTNPPVRAALDVWADRKDAQTFAEVIRRALSGSLLLDTTDSVIADPAAGFGAGDTLSIASMHDNAGKHVLLAYTAHEHLSLARQAPGASLVQPAASVLEMAATRYEGLVIDGRSAGAFIAYAGEIRRAVGEDAEAAARATAATLAHPVDLEAAVAALADERVYIPFEPVRDAEGRELGIRVPGATGPDGRSFAVAGTAPAQLWAWSPAVGAQPTTLARIAAAAIDDGQAGIVINPMGPSVLIPAERLAAVAAG